MSHFHLGARLAPLTLFAVALCTTASVQAQTPTPVVSDELPTVSPGPQRFAFPERTYVFDVPANGKSRSQRTVDGRQNIQITDESGRRVAEAIGTATRYDEVTFYNATPQGYTLVIPILYGDADSGAASSLERARVPRKAAPSSVMRRRARSLATCGADLRAPLSVSWSGPFNWYINTGSIPSNLNQATAIQHIRNGRIAWETNDNYCSIGDASGINFAYQGSTTATVGLNGLNTVGWGTSTCGPTALACGPYWVSGSTIMEADIRYNAARSWVTSGAGGSTSCTPCDVWGVATHETGHNIGFDHVSGNDNVMSSAFETGAESTSARRLGRGDANANNAKY